MMLLVTPEDFQKLSRACRQELIALLSSRSTQTLGSEAPDYHGEDEEAGTDGYQQQVENPTIDDVLEEKCVVDITVEQAQDLIANISRESQQTLRLFAPGSPIALDELIGKDGPYRDFNHLKRSCVGAVNRRLRTVLGNRLAVLFSSDRDKTRIKITPLSAASLRQVLEIPEPMPAFEFVDRKSGECISATSGAAKKLQERLQLTWREFDGRPEDRRPSVDDTNVLKHFMDNGFDATTGIIVASNEDSEVFEFDPTGTSAQWRSRLDIPLIRGGDIENVDVFLSHKDVPEVLARCESVMLPRQIAAMPLPRI